MTTENARDEMARDMATATIGGIFGPQADDYRRADALIEKGYRKIPSNDQLRESIMAAIWNSYRPGYPYTEASEDMPPEHHQFDEARIATEAIIKSLEDS